MEYFYSLSIVVDKVFMRDYMITKSTWSGQCALTYDANNDNAVLKAA